MSNKLNSRQWKLYELLKNNPDRKFKQLEIACKVPDYWATWKGENIEFHNSNTRLQITNDIRAINDSDVVQKIIISDGKGVGLASREEFAKYINGQFAAIFRKLERTRKKAIKAGLDGQMRFTVGMERDTVEAFTDDINRLKAARLAKGLKLADVAKELRKTEKGVDVPLLSKIENGYCKANESVLLKLSEIYGVEPFYLTGGKVYGVDVIA